MCVYIYTFKTVFGQLDIRQHRTVIPERRKTKEVNTMTNSLERPRKVEVVRQNARDDRAAYREMQKGPLKSLAKH